MSYNPPKSLHTEALSINSQNSGRTSNSVMSASQMLINCQRANNLNSLPTLFNAHNNAIILEKLKQDKENLSQKGSQGNTSVMEERKLAQVETQSEQHKPSSGHTIP